MGGFFAGLAGGLASGFGERRQRQFQLDHEDRQRRTAALTHILDSPDAQRDAKEWALDQIIAIGEHTDGKKNAKPSPISQMLKPLMDKIHGSQQPVAGQSAAPDTGGLPPVPGSAKERALGVEPAVAAPPGADASGMVGGAPTPPQTQAPGMVGVTNEMLQQRPPMTLSAPPEESPAAVLPPVPGSTAAAAARKGGRPDHLFRSQEEKAAADSKLYLDRHRAMKKAELEVSLEAIPQKITAVEKAMGRKLTDAEKKVYTNAEFGIHGQARPTLIKGQVKGEAYGYPGEVGQVVIDPITGEESFYPSKATEAKQTAGDAANERLIAQVMESEKVDRPTAVKRVADMAVQKTKGQAAAAEARPAEVVARTKTQGDLSNNLRARTAKTVQDQNKAFGQLEGDKNTAISRTITKYSGLRAAAQKLPDGEAKTKRLADLAAEEATQKALAQTTYERKVAQLNGKKAATAAPAAQGTPPASLVPPGKVVTFKNGTKWQNINGTVSQVK